MELPFNEILDGGFNVRTFSSTLEETELKWHFDEEDRIIICEEETDWMLQIDDELPTKIERNRPYFIPEGTYHRVIKGTSDFTVKVKKLNKK